MCTQTGTELVPVFNLGLISYEPVANRMLLSKKMAVPFIPIQWHDGLREGSTQESALKNMDLLATNPKIQDVIEIL